VFTHYLITRFNIRVSGFGPETMDSSAMDEGWLRERVKLFNTICVPSVIGQRNTNFEWLIYMDPSTSLDEFAHLTESTFPVHFIFATDYEDMIKDIRLRIVAAPSSFVITTRLDNDDVISSVFIETIQQSFQPRDKLIINLNAGYDYHSNIHLLTKWNRRYRNNFMSLVEDKNADRLYTVYGFPHWKPPAEAEIVNIEGQPYWIYWRHGMNFSDQEKRGIPVFSKPDPKLFSYTVSSISISWKNTLHYFAVWFPKMLKRRLSKIFTA
jgi:hypothetical protein